MRWNNKSTHHQSQEKREQKNLRFGIWELRFPPNSLADREELRDIKIKESKNGESLKM